MSDITTPPRTVRGWAISANAEEMVLTDDLPGTVSVDRPALESISIHVVRENDARLAELVRLFYDGALQVAVHEIMRFADA